MGDRVDGEVVAGVAACSCCMLGLWEVYSMTVLHGTLCHAAGMCIDICAMQFGWVVSVLVLCIA